MPKAYSGIDAPNAKQAVLDWIDARADSVWDMAMRIWEWAELGYRETNSAALLADWLEAEGFEVERAIEGMPTAFEARWGEGGPAIGFLAEYDALPGLSQAARAQPAPGPNPDAGHGCGHHALGAGAVAAAAGFRHWLEKTGIAGCVRVFGSPAEEGGAGKAYLARAGRFDRLGAVLHWHPDGANDASPKTSLANISARFRFRGRAAHAAGKPHLGRSALGGLEAMHFMINLMRGHIESSARLHYIVSRGGAAPNIVPDFAESYLYARHPTASGLRPLWARVLKAAEGAALGTETAVEHEVMHGAHEILPNVALARVIDANLRALGGVRWNRREIEFAEAICQTLEERGSPLESIERIKPFEPKSMLGSTDVGDVSWNAPTAGVWTACVPPGVPLHSWQATACGARTMRPGMLLAAKALATSAVDLTLDSAALKEARDEFQSRRGEGFVYRPTIGDRPPPLDYRS